MNERKQGERLACVVSGERASGRSEREEVLRGQAVGEVEQAMRRVSRDRADTVCEHGAAERARACYCGVER